MEPNSYNIAHKSEVQACRACRKQKRRCDKGVPACSLCQRMGRPCEYGDVLSQPPPTPEALAAIRAQLRDLEDRLAHSGNSSGGHSSPPGSFFSAYDVVETAHHLPEKSSTASSRDSSTCVNYRSQQWEGQRKRNPHAALFLDVDCFGWSRLRLPTPRLSIPTEVLTLLSQGNVVVDTCHEYFATIHCWMPIVSKKRMDLGLPVQSGGPDLAMLFLTMKLLLAQVDEVDENNLYFLTKSFLAALQNSGAVSLLCLQAMILVAIYEYGHGIYPAAWMTVGACARYSEILNLSCPSDRSVLGQPITWTEAEERRRVWWGIYVLDRLISVGSRKAFSLAEVPLETRLPVDDAAWDAGDVTRAIGHSLSTPYQVYQSPFARLCQAAVYVSRAVTSARVDSPMTNSRIVETMSIVDEICCFSAAVDTEADVGLEDSSLALLAPRSVARSALYIALDVFTCPEKIDAGDGLSMSSTTKTQDELKLQRHSIQIIQKASEQVHGLSSVLLAWIEERSFQGGQLGKVSPFAFDGIYCACATFHWLLGENGDGAYRSNAEDLSKFIEVLNGRWRLAEQYSELIRLYDINTRSRSLDTF